MRIIRRTSNSTKIGGAIMIGAIEFIAERTLDTIDSTLFANISLIDKFLWGFPIFLLLFGLFLIFSPAIENWVSNIGNPQKTTSAKLKSSIKDKPQYSSNLVKTITPILEKAQDAYDQIDKYPQFIKKFESLNGVHKEIFEGITYKGFEFYTGRKVLSQTRPISNLEKADCIWGMWNAAALAFQTSIIKKANIQKLLLPHPDNMSLESLARAAKKKTKDLVSIICTLTDEALEKRQKQDDEQSIPLSDRIEVRWHFNLTGNTITVGNPKSDKISWIQFEMMIPSTEIDDRPSIYLTKEPFTELFNNLFNAYLDIWNNSKTPTEDEIAKWISHK